MPSSCPIFTPWTAADPNTDILFGRSVWYGGLAKVKLYSLVSLFGMRASQLSPHQHEKCVTKLSHHHLPTQVPKSPHCSQDSESAKILAHFLGGVKLPQTCSSQKSPKIGSFLLKSVVKLELQNIKSQLSFNLLVFLGHDMKRQHSMLNFAIMIKVEFESQNMNKWILPLHPVF